MSDFQLPFSNSEFLYLFLFLNAQKGFGRLSTKNKLHLDLVKENRGGLVMILWEHTMKQR